MSSMDHKEQAQSRIYAQYRDKPKLVDWIGINGELANELEAAFCAVAQSYDIDSGGTDELDVIGRIVAIGRSFIGPTEIQPDMFGSTQFGRGQFKTGNNQGIIDLSNSIYRLLIRAKISRNNNDATLDGIIEAISFVVATNDITISDPEDMSFDVAFGQLTAEEALVLANFDIVPKPQGVRLGGFINKSAVSEFGRSQFGRSQYAYKF